MESTRLRDLREDHDLTQTEVAKSLHMSQRAYSHYECGDRRLYAELLVSIAEFYNTNIDYILGRTDVRTPLKSNKKSDA